MKKFLSFFLLAVLIFSVLPLSPVKPVSANSGTDFSIAWITDTQNLASYYPSLDNATTQWIIDNNATYNFKMVIHTGDSVNSASNQTQWDAANASMGILLANNMPFCWCSGNDDGSGKASWSGTLEDCYNPATMNSKSYWVSSHGDLGNFANAQSTAVAFTYGSYKFLIIDLSYDADSYTLTWMKQLLNSYSDYNIIVATHSFLCNNGTIGNPMGDGTWELALNTTLSGYPNVFLTLNGHAHEGSNCTSKVSYGSRTDLMFDMQDYRGGNGAAVRILSFDLAAKTVSVKTYSTWNSSYFADSDEMFSFSVPSLQTAATGFEYMVNVPSSLPLNMTLMYANGTADAALTNVSSSSWVSGGGIALNRSLCQTIEMPSTLTANFTAKTVLIWISCNAPFAVQTVYYASKYDSHYGEYIDYDAGPQEQICLKNSAGSETDLSTISVPDPTKAQLMGYTWDGSKAYSILNTKIAMGVAFAGTLASYDTNVSLGNNCVDAYADGTFYSMYITNQNITQAQLTAIYNAGPTGFCYAPGLVEYYPFNEGSGSVAYGYDVFTNFTASGSPLSVYPSCGASEAVNSTAYWGLNNYASSFPYTSGIQTWNLAFGNVTQYRYNSTAQRVLYLTDSCSSPFYLTAQTPSHGSLNLTSGWYSSCASVPILATADAGYVLQYINVDGVNYSSNPCTLTMGWNHTVTAYFGLLQYYLTVTLDGHESVNQSFGWFANGTSVGILATPNPYYYFQHFTVDGNLVSLNPTSVLMTSNHTVYVYSYSLKFYLTIIPLLVFVLATFAGLELIRRWQRSSQPDVRLVHEQC